MAEESTTRIAIRTSPEREEEQPRRRRVSLIGQFQKLDPPKFRGEEGPEAAEDFVSELEKIFGVLGCTSEEKLLMAEYSLQRGAENWWNASKDGAMVVYTGDVWTVFKRAFLGKYFPHTFREDRALEFAQLVQGKMSVDDYEGRFAVLSRYGPHMEAEWKARKFELGLDPLIRLQVAPFMLSSYEDIYRRAQNIEKALAAVREKEEAESSKRTMGGGFPPRKRFRTERYQPAPRSFYPRPPRPPMSSRSYTYGGRQGS